MCLHLSAREVTKSVSFMQQMLASVADKVDVIAEAPEGALETPVLYPVGLTVDAEASDAEAAAADAFLEYLQTNDAMKVFEKYGFAAI